MKLLVTGGAGFIGSAVVRKAIAQGITVINVDKLTYAGNLESVKEASSKPNYVFEQADICDRAAMDSIFRKYKPDFVMHLAAESHVDRSIDGPSTFIETNIMGTYELLEVTRSYFQSLDQSAQGKFRFHHISTDEVFGSLTDTGFFTEETSYKPNSPYSASKASSDHLVRAWHHTYKLPVVTTNCSNNYGPYQFPEKLIPLMILNALDGKPLPVYGKGDNVRDWLYVDDHADALLLVLKKGRLGETYNIGGHNEKKNIDVVHTICDVVDSLRPNSKIGPRRSLVKLVTDRPGHDMRYAIDAGKVFKELGWQPKETFDTGLTKTVQWYLENLDGWCKRVKDGSYQGERLGLG